MNICKAKVLPAVIVDSLFARKNISEPDEPNSMLKGMKGYELTAGDLEFIKKMKEEKLIKKYQVIQFFSVTVAA